MPITLLPPHKGHTQHVHTTLTAGGPTSVQMSHPQTQRYFSHHLGPVSCSCLHPCSQGWLCHPGLRHSHHGASSHSPRFLALASLLRHQLPQQCVPAGTDHTHRAAKGHLTSSFSTQNNHKPSSWLLKNSDMTTMSALSTQVLILGCQNAERGKSLHSWLRTPSV